MAKKFFHDRVYNTKRTIINVAIIGVCIIGIILCFVITSNFEAVDKRNLPSVLTVKEEVTIEVNQKFENEIFFSKIENYDVNTIKINYPDNFDITKTGTYELSLDINEQLKTVKLIIVDTMKPILKLKDVSISENDSYSANDFVDSCKDNSTRNCIIEFYSKGTDENGKVINYSKYTKAGSYPVKIQAKDESGNITIEEANLIISKKSSVTPTPTPTPGTNCKHGNNVYDTSKYVLAVDVTTNGCAISLDLYKDSSMTDQVKKILDSETTRIKKDIESLDLDGILALNRNVKAIVNKSGDGFVGYQITMIATLSKNGNDTTVAEYLLNSKGERIFNINPYKLGK